MSFSNKNKTLAKRLTHQELGNLKGIFCQKQYIKQKSIIASIKKLEKMKIKNLHTFFTGITQKRAVTALFSFWSLNKRKLEFTEKVKRNRF